MKSIFAESRKGIIPAYAGSTGRRACSCSSTRDHPRIRGEHMRDYIDGDYRTGSSPHTRGAHCGRAAETPKNGIIPAYAGSTHASLGRSRFAGDHPRIRGEHCEL